MAAKVKSATKATAAPRGLQLTTAQQAAYSKAYSAAATIASNKIALASSAQKNRKYQLQYAAGQVKIAKASQRSAQAAHAAAYATQQSYRQSRLAHQNAALQSRIEMNMTSHVKLAANLQYAAASNKAWAHAAVMQTVTNAQSVVAAKSFFAYVAKTAFKASKSTTGPYKATAASTAVAKIANAAGVAAARRVPASAAAPRTAPNYGNMAAAMAAAHSQRKNQLGKTEWLGDEVTPNCIITAVANHLLHAKGILVTSRDLRELYEACDPEPLIEQVLWAAYTIAWPASAYVRLKDYTRFPYEYRDEPLLVIGYKVTCADGTKGDHAALSLKDGNVVSWGSVVKREAPVEEAWGLQWEV